MLSRQGLYFFSHASRSFDLVILEIRSRLDHGSPVIAGMTDMSSMPNFYLLRWVLTNFLPRLTVILPISASQVSKITGVSHQFQLVFVLSMKKV
jgi:hypothetical protein